MKNLFHYLDRPSPIHRLTGAAKLVCVILWSLASMLTYDTRLLAAIAVLSALLFAVSRVRLRDVAAILWLMPPCGMRTERRPSPATSPST